MSKRRRDEAPPAGVTASAADAAVDAIVSFLTPKVEPATQQQLQAGTGLSSEELLPALNALLLAHRLKIFSSGSSTCYKLVAEDMAAKLATLSVEDRLVLGYIEKAG